MVQSFEPSHKILGISEERWRGRVDMLAALEDVLDDYGDCACDLNYRCSGHKLRDELQWLCYPAQARRVVSR